VNFTPLFHATVERHAAVGFGWLAGNRTWDFAIERRRPRPVPALAPLA